MVSFPASNAHKMTTNVDRPLRGIHETYASGTDERDIEDNSIFQVFPNSSVPGPVRSVSRGDSVRQRFSMVMFL